MICEHCGNEFDELSGGLCDSCFMTIIVEDEYSCATEPPVRYGVSQRSGNKEPSHVIKPKALSHEMGCLIPIMNMVNYL